jgi:gas vesicle protein
MKRRYGATFQNDPPHGAAMEIEESLDESSREIEATDSSRGAAGFAGGLLLGIVLGAGIALLFAPEQGQKTRGRLRKRMRSLGEDAREGLERAGSHTRKELLRRQRRLRAELERVSERAKEALD